MSEEPVLVDFINLVYFVMHTQEGADHFRDKIKQLLEGSGFYNVEVHNIRMELSRNKRGKLVARFPKALLEGEVK